MRVKVIELQGFPHTLTQNDGNTFRIFPREEKVLDDSLISDEFRAEEKLGYLSIVHEVEEKITKVKNKKEEIKNA